MKWSGDVLQAASVLLCPTGKLAFSEQLYAVHVLVYRLKFCRLLLQDKRGQYYVIEYKCID